MPATRLLPGVWLLCSALALAACGEAPAPLPPPGPKRVDVLRLQAPERVVERSFPGRVRAAERVDLSFNVPGRIVALDATEGTRVEQGAVLAELDARDYRSRLRAVEAEHKEAEANYQRARKLLEAGYISRAEHDQLKAARDVVAAELATVRKTLADTKLRAPFDGVVAKRYVENFTEVRAKQPVLSLQNLSNLEIVVDVPEQFVARRSGRPRLSLEARFETLPGRTFPLTIKEHATEADPKTGTYRYVTALKAPQGARILPGMTATVIARRVDPPSAEDHRFVVPIPAVFAHVTLQPRVWVVDRDNRVRARAVELGRLTGTSEVEILEGLRTGEVVVVQAAPRLREGMEIVPVQRQTLRNDSES